MAKTLPVDSAETGIKGFYVLLLVPLRLEQGNRVSGKAMPYFWRISTVTVVMTPRLAPSRPASRLPGFRARAGGYTRPGGHDRA